MILLFSGTGNSLHVANQIAGPLGERIVRLPLKDDTVDLSGDNRVIWVFPVYSWGVPPVVLKQLRKINIKGAEKAVHHCVMTCGDDVGQTDRMWRTAIANRGWESASVFSVQMPNTYVLMKGFDVDSPELAAEKIEKSVPRCKEIAGWIDRNPTDVHTDVVRGGFAWIKTKIIYPYFVKFEMSPKPFHSTEACVGCGSCSRICPLNNIEMKDRRPQWGTDCALCLGCYHVCPYHAVAYGNATKNKGRKEILCD